MKGLPKRAAQIHVQPLPRARPMPAGNLSAHDGLLRPSSPLPHHFDCRHAPFQPGEPTPQLVIQPHNVYGRPPHRLALRVAACSGAAARRVAAMVQGTSQRAMRRHVLPRRWANMYEAALQPKWPKHGPFTCTLDSFNVSYQHVVCYECHAHTTPLTGPALGSQCRSAACRRPRFRSR